MEPAAREVFETASKVLGCDVATMHGMARDTGLDPQKLSKAAGHFNVIASNMERMADRYEGPSRGSQRVALSGAGRNNFQSYLSAQAGRSRGKAGEHAQLCHVPTGGPGLHQKTRRLGGP